MTWTVKYASGVEKQLRKLGAEPSQRIRRYMQGHVGLLEDPRSVGRPLLGELTGFWRYRVGDYRVICDVRDEALIVLVVDVGHRREIYR